MRRTALLTLLLALVLPAAAWASGTVAGDGTLSIRNGYGMVRLDLDRGVVIGRVGSGRLELLAPKDSGCTTALVWNDGEQMLGDLELRTLDGDEVVACIYVGKDLRFRLLGSESASLRISGLNISLSAVGRGKGQIRGRTEVKPATFDGTWSLNGEEYASLPDERRAFLLAAAIVPE